MQQSYYQKHTRRERSGAFPAGFILALIAGLIIFGIGFWTNFHNSFPNGTLIALVFLFAFFGTPFLAGLIGTLSTSRVDTGIAAGVWNGLFVGIFMGVYIFLLLENNAPIKISPQVIKQVQDQLAQGGIQISVQTLQFGSGYPTSYTGIVITDLLLLLVWLGLGALLGLIGALIGKIFAPGNTHISDQPDTNLQEAPLQENGEAPLLRVEMASS
ncbi:hypothetical protein [Dictyobacter kobayashii]|uniref:Uncharacterized protein n=1 Tax=Dictyobacter kobayashii TaxID=2014872 RepID=A0A402AYB6_9CHLR|nr:hypothetical protein [Dictyobacter kobayashii]GCE24074.1 hypothetical protein KDK_78740 [Dictyobacter kobayashii]